MKLFNRHTGFFYVLKLFKITDQQSASKFPINKLFLETINYVEHLTGLKSSDFHLNYTKDYKSIVGFKAALNSLQEIVYGSVVFGKEGNNCFLAIDNAMINYDIKPQNALAELFFKFSETYYNPEEIIKLCKELIINFDFEYGYVQRFPNSVDGRTERKVKRGLFSKSVEITELDHVWTFHSIGLKHGYIKNLYNINFINESHFDSPELIQIIKNYGNLNLISPSISMWTVSDEEIVILKTMSVVKQKLIQADTTKNEFLKGADSKIFYDRMALPHMKTSRR